jgi:hypothetical protein
MKSISLSYLLPIDSSVARKVEHTNE